MPRALPADRYVVFDDKLDVLARVKRMDGRTFTVHVRQGHYAHADAVDAEPGPDRSLDAIGDLLHLGRADFLTQ